MTERIIESEATKGNFVEEKIIRKRYLKPKKKIYRIVNNRAGQ